MALEALRGAFLSSLFDDLFEKIASLDVIRFFRRKKLDEALLNELKRQLRSAEEVMDVAEIKQLGSRPVRDWLRELKAATYDAEDLMIEIDNEEVRCEMEEGESSSRPNKVIKLASSLFNTNSFVTQVESKIQEILGRLKSLLDQTHALGLTKDVQSRALSHFQRSLATSLVEESDVFGRDAERGRIVELLMSSDGCDEISVIPIVGMGGIGKTTLAGLVYNDDQVQKHFHVRAWVTVSDNYSVARVTKTILEDVKPRSQERNLGNLNQLQVELKEALMGKKFLFVLDDIWDESYEKWDGLRRAFQSGAKGSKIIVTTRNSKIASMMTDSNVSPHQLEAISNKDCLKLFMKHANVSLDLKSTLEIICDIVVKRCKGLPLAVKSLAGLLRFEPNLAEWEKILKSDLWELPYEKVEITPALWLSYHYLPSHLKRCFTYCAIFPHDYYFKKQELILLWVAENLLPRQKGKRLEEVGEEYFNDLVSRSMFQKSPYHPDNQELFSMHDLVSDLTKFVFGEFCTCLEENDSDTSISNIIRHLSFKIENACGPKMSEALSQAKSLRTLLALPMCRYPSNLLPYESLQLNLLFMVLSLRVLCLPNHPSTELPDSIGDLKHLRYLNLSFSELKRLPDTVCNLYNLQILLLSSCGSLTRLPTKIGRLINLRHLDVAYTPLQDLPKDIDNLKNLQFLSNFVVVGEESGSNIQRLKKLHRLHGKLRISRLQNTGDIAHISGSILEEHYLNELILGWDKDDDSNDPERERVLLDKLRPHTTLQTLDINGYGGERFSEWLADISFSNITTMSLRNCKNCSSLPSLGQLPSLKELDIWEFDKLEKIGEEFFGNGSTPFRSLKTLTIFYMPRWEEWSFSRGEGAGGVFPCLTRLHIRDCWQLVRLVSGAPQHETHTPFPSLQQLIIDSCPILESFLEWGSFSTLESIKFFNCRKLWELRMQWDLQRFKSLTSLTLCECDDVVDSFPEEGLLPTTLTSLQISHFRYLKALNGRGLRQLTSLKRLEICNCFYFKCLPEERLPNSLSFLKISNCGSLLRERCQRETGEDWPKIAHISQVIIF